MKRLFKRLSLWSKSVFPLLIFILAVSNVVTSCCISRSVRPAFQYRVLVVTNEVVSASELLPSELVATNSPSASSLPSLPSSLSSPSSPPPSPVPPQDRSIPVAYNYFLMGNEPVAYLFGRYYYEGEATSRGLILRIFPDRIYLHDGSYFVNESLGGERPRRHSKEKELFP